jgi:hypothetical protein
VLKFTGFIFNEIKHAFFVFSFQKKEEAVLVRQTVLSSLSGFVDWVNISHITHEDGRLLRLLCENLKDQDLQLHAAECLLLIVSRKVGGFFIYLFIVFEYLFIVFENFYSTFSSCEL